DDLLGRDIDEAALFPQPLHHIHAADALDDLGVNGAARAGLQAFRGAGEIDLRTLVGGNLRDHFVDVGEDVLGRLCQSLAALLHAENVGKLAYRSVGIFKASIDQQIGDTRLCLHAIGEGSVGVVDGAEIDDEVRLLGQQSFEVERIAAACQPAKLR